MKRIILFLSFFLMACSQELTSTPAPSEVTDDAQTNLTPVVDSTTISSTFSPVATLPGGPVTLVALGDSLTQGDGDDSGLGYTGRLLAMVNAVRPGSSLSNLGQSGWNSDALINGDQGLTGQLERAIAELEDAKSQGRASVALVWIGSNDLWYLYEFGEGSDENDSLDAEHFESNMNSILTQLRAAGARVIVALLDDQSKRPVAIKGEAFTSITPDELKRMSLQVTRYNEIISENAARHDALTVDFYSTDIFTNPATLYDDGNHPNSAGYDILAQKWFEVISLILN